MGKVIVKGCNNCVNVEKQHACEECFGCVCFSNWKLKPRNEGDCLICGGYEVDRDVSDRCKKAVCQAKNVEVLHTGTDG